MFSSRKTGSASNNYLLTRSLRFRSSASAYLNRTFGTPTLSTKWTWSGWLKFGYGSSYYTIFDGGSPDTRFGRDPSTNQLYVNNDTTNYIITTPVYRDYSAWYHAVLAFDSSQGTASNRLRLYINGSEVTAFATDNRSSISGAIGINTATAHGIGRQPSGGSAYFDGYMTEINFIDGQQLTPSSFGSTNSATGVWQPIKYTGTYGTNGFYLPFTNTTSTTTLGNDSSGNGNNWTTNNISVTAGTTYDSMTDVPTLTSATAGNYSVFNPLLNVSNASSWYSPTISGGNLNASMTQANNYAGGNYNLGTTRVTTGKWYAEFTINTRTNVPSGNNDDFGITVGLDTFVSYSPDYGCVYIASTGNTRTNGGAYTAYGNSYTAGDVIGVALDMTNGKVWFSKNNTWQNSGDPVAGTNPAATSLSGSYGIGFQVNTFSNAGQWTTALSANYGQQGFKYTPPTGFVALNTFNLPTPTIGATASTVANKYFDATTFTGNASTNVITNSGSMQPDMVWLKSRSNANNHTLYDALRGVNTLLYPNLTNAEATGTGQLTSFNSNGFTLGANENANDTNGESSVGWQWRASNASGVTNTSGSITSTVSANTSAGFSIVTYTCNGSANQSVGHGLGVAPSMVIVKDRDQGTGFNWNVWFTGFNKDEYLLLNSTSAKGSFNTVWNIVPDSSKFYIGSTGTGVNNGTDKMVAYCFAQVAGYSAFGSYTGNGSSDGPFVFTGFRPRYVMAKVSSTTGPWNIFDSARGTYNVNTPDLWANSSIAETGNNIDFLSNGFKVRDGGGDMNGSGSTYIYMAFCESPFKFSLAR